MTLSSPSHDHHPNRNVDNICDHISTVLLCKTLPTIFMTTVMMVIDEARDILIWIANWSRNLVRKLRKQRNPAMNFGTINMTWKEECKETKWYARKRQESVLTWYYRYLYFYLYFLFVFVFCIYICIWICIVHMFCIFIVYFFSSIRISYLC